QTAMALCRDAAGATFLMQGPADAELTSVVTMDPAMQYDIPRFSPDGDHLFISHMDWTAYTDTFIEFASDGTSVQKVASFMPKRDSMYEAFELSTPSRDGHLIYTDYD